MFDRNVLVYLYIMRAKLIDILKIIHLMSCPTPPLYFPIHISDASTTLEITQNYAQI